VGDYHHSGAPFGITLEGGHRFETDPANVAFLVEIVNDYYSQDNYMLHSYNNRPLSPTVTVDIISWYLDDPTQAAVSSEALTDAPPDLARWQQTLGLSISGRRQDAPGMYEIQARVTSVEKTWPTPRVTPPPTETPTPTPTETPTPTPTQTPTPTETPMPTETPTPTPTATPTPTSTPTPTGTPTPTSTPTPTPSEIPVTPGASGVTASTHDGNVPANTVDNDLGTRWSGYGSGAWIRYDLGTVRTVTRVSLAAYQGNRRRNRFDLQVSSNGWQWTTVLANARTSGTTTAQESFDFADRPARYVRYVGRGYESTSGRGPWNSLTEVDVFAVP
jgi:outer membrane biosynthesis protein TonB